MSYVAWYNYVYSQKLLKKLEDAYDLLDEYNDLSNSFDRDEFIEDRMQEEYMRREDASR